MRTKDFFQKTKNGYDGNHERLSVHDGYRPDIFKAGERRDNKIEGGWDLMLWERFIFSLLLIYL